MSCFNNLIRFVRHGKTARGFPGTIYPFCPSILCLITVCRYELFIDKNNLTHSASAYTLTGNTYIYKRNRTFLCSNFETTLFNIFPIFILKLFQIHPWVSTRCPIFNFFFWGVSGELREKRLRLQIKIIIIESF